LRTVYRLEIKELVKVVKSPGERLERVRLTKAGMEAIGSVSIR